MNSPLELLKRGVLTFPTIELNAYSRSLSEELSLRGKSVLLHVYRDMLYIRHFENALLQAKKEGRFNLTAHLSIGQEAVSVGEALALAKEDIIFGTHRSHGEFLAKSLRFIEESSDDELENVLKTYQSDTYSAVKDYLKGSTKEKAIQFILYGGFSEIFARTTGLERGLGGSMHLHFTPFGVYPNNAIVGGSAPLALGAALYNRINDVQGVVVANLGDGSLGCGAVYESIAFATMNQFKGLWAEKKGLPLLFLVSDNLYARGGMTKTETGSYDNPARLGAGFTTNAMNAESVNGLNPLAVAEAVARHREKLLKGEGSSLINAVTYRQCAHSIGDENQRDESELNEWLSLDPIGAFKKALIRENVSTNDELEKIEKEVISGVNEAYAHAMDESVSPKLNLQKDNGFTTRFIFNNGTVPKRKSSLGLKESPLYLELKNKGAKLTLRDAIQLAIMESFDDTPTLVAYGEDVRGWQSSSSVYKGLEQYLPYEKLFNTPIAEAAIVGAEVGYAMRGGVVLAELLYADFLTRSADEIINQAAKWQSLSGGTLKLPLTLRLPIGRSYGGQHSQDLSGIIARINGLKVYYPATPYDAYAVTKEAIASTDPVVIFEPKEYYAKTELYKNVENGSCKVENTSTKATGSEFTVVTVGSCLYDVEEALKRANVSADLLSLVRLAPIDYAPIIASVKNTGKLIVVGESNVTSGLMSEIVAKMQKECFNYLKAPIEVVGLPDGIIPTDKDSGYYDIKEKVLKILKKS